MPAPAAQTPLIAGNAAGGSSDAPPLQFVKKQLLELGHAVFATGLGVAVMMVRPVEAPIGRNVLRVHGSVILCSGEHPQTLTEPLARTYHESRAQATV